MLSSEGCCVRGNVATPLSRGSRSARCQETDGTPGSDTAPNLSHSCGPFRVPRGLSPSSSKRTAPTDPAASVPPHVTFPSRSPCSCPRPLERYKPRPGSFLKEHPCRIGITCMHLPSRLHTPHRPANKVGHTLTGGVSQLRLVESQACGMVPAGPEMNVHAAV